MALVGGVPREMAGACWREDGRSVGDQQNARLGDSEATMGMK